MKIAILGGGIIGLCCAYYLQKEGHEIILIDKSTMQEGASYGNAGHVVPSHFVPLASPGMIAKALQWMLSSSSPFYIKPRMDMDLIQWGYHFWKSCKVEIMNKNIPHLQQLLALSRSELSEMQREIGNSFLLKEQGILIAYKTASSELHEIALSRQALKMGLHSEILNRHQVQNLESSTTMDVRGAILYKQDAHLDPALFTTAIKNYLLDSGVSFYPECVVEKFEITGTKIQSVITNQLKINADVFILSNGAWLNQLTRKLGFKIPLQAGKGYSISFPDFNPQLHYPAILVDHRVVTTPIGKLLRLAGFMEINAPGSAVNTKRIQAIMNSVKLYYPDLMLSLDQNHQLWQGYRPVSPDGLPYIGRHSEFNNLIIAGGHAMLGISLANGTGKLVKEIIQQEHTSIPVSAFTLNRFGS
jgi:D-amino-acid dehydrogenase